MKKEKLYQVGMLLDLKGDDIDDISKSQVDSGKISTGYEMRSSFDIYKIGVHYGTISVKDFPVKKRSMQNKN